MERLNEEQIKTAIEGNPRLAGVLSSESLRQFATWVVKGQTQPVRRMLYLLVRGYMENCGISPIPRTLYFEAGQCLFAQLTNTRNTLPMEDLNDDYTEEDYKEFGTTRLDQDEFLIYCMTECSFNIPDDMKAALCFGIFLHLTASRNALYRHRILPGAKRPDGESGRDTERI